VFLSHRRFDWSRQLAEALIAHGVRVYHDHDRPVVDEQVQLELDEALKHSRFVAVCASPGIGDSVYCRAEFLPGIAHAVGLNITRVLVLTSGAEIELPSELSAMTLVRVDTPAGIAAFAEYVQRENRVTFPPRAADQSHDFASSFNADCRFLLDRLRGWHERREARRAAGFTVRSAEEWPERTRLALALWQIGEMLEEVAAGENIDERRFWVWQKQIVTTSRDCPQRFLDYLWRCAHALMGATQTDIELLATDLLVWAARRGGIPDERTLLSRLIVDKTRPGRNERVCGPLLERMREMPSLRDATVIERALVSFPSLFAGERADLTRDLLDAARAKQDTPGFDRSVLPATEEISLVLRRLSYLRRLWVNGDDIPLFDLENVVRDLPINLRQARDRMAPAALFELGEAILMQLFEPAEGRGPLISRLEVYELVDAFGVIVAIVDSDRRHAPKLVQLLADAVRAAGYQATAAAIAAQAVAVAAGDEPEYEAISLAFHEDYESTRRRQRPRPS
jgi:hypothetical protein